MEKIKTDILYSVIYFVENRAVYEIMWKNCGTASQATDCNIIRRMPTACWITKATKIEYVILIALPWQKCLREHASILRFFLSVSFLFPVVEQAYCLMHAWNRFC